MFPDQSMCARGFGVRLVCQLCIHLSRAKGIALLHMYSELDVYFDGDMWGMLGGYKWIVMRGFLKQCLQGWLICCFVYQ
jgi:hypothetical protein